MNKSLSKNLILNMMYQILSLIVPFITTPYIARILGPNNVGEYTYVHSIGSFFVLFSILGLRNYGSRTIAEVRKDNIKRNKIFNELFTMQLISSIITLILYVIYLIFICKSNFYLSIAIGLYVISSTFDISWYFAGMEKFKTIVFRGIILKLVNLLLIFSLVKNQNDVLLYTLIFSGGEFISQLLLWPLLLKEVNLKLSKYNDWKQHLKPNLTLFVPTIAASIYQVMDKIMIGSISSNAQLAYYEYADKFISIPNILSTAIGTVMLSHIAYELTLKNNKFKETIGEAMDLTFIIGFACTFGLLAIADELILCYYGSEYTSCGLILKCLTSIIVLYSWSNVLRMQYIIPFKMDNIYIKSTIIGAVVNLIINAILIPIYASVGAAIGTILANLSIAIYYTIILKNKLPLKEYIKRNIPILIIGVIMYISIKFVQLFHIFNWYWLIFDVVLAMIIFGLLTLMYGKKCKNHLLKKIVK